MCGVTSGQSQSDFGPYGEAMATTTAKLDLTKPIVATVPPVSSDPLTAPWPAERRRWRAGEQVRCLSVGVGSDSNVATVWLEHRRHPGLSYRLDVSPMGELVSFYVGPLSYVNDGGTVGSPALSATMFREVPLGQLHTAAVAALDLVRLVGAQPPADRKRARRSPVTDHDLAVFASEYVAAIAQGQRAPLRNLAERHHLSYSGASERRRLCVSRGMMTTLGQGRAGGTLTDRAREALRLGA